MGCVLGAMLAGTITDHLGRKKVLLISAVLFLISAVGSSIGTRDPRPGSTPSQDRVEPRFAAQPDAGHHVQNAAGMHALVAVGQGGTDPTQKLKFLRRETPDLRRLVWHFEFSATAISCFNHRASWFAFCCSGRSVIATALLD